MQRSAFSVPRPTVANALQLRQFCVYIGVFLFVSKAYICHMHSDVMKHVHDGFRLLVHLHHTTVTGHTCPTPLCRAANLVVIS